MDDSVRGAANRGSSDSNASDPTGILLFVTVSTVILAFLVAVAALLLIERLTGQALIDADSGIGGLVRFMLHADWPVFLVTAAAMTASLAGLLRGRRWLRDSEPGELVRVTGGLLVVLGVIAVVVIAVCLAADTTLARFAAPAAEPLGQLSQTARLWLQMCAAWLALVFALLFLFRR